MGFMKWFFSPLSNQQDQAKSSNLSIREQALANMRAARERIGDDEIQKMAESLRAESMKVKAEKARKEILSADKAKIARHVKDMMKDDD